MKEFRVKKDFILWSAVSAVIMLILPGLAAAVVPGDAGMAACFLLFFLVNPVYSVISGSFAGKDRKRLWSLPILSAVLFLAGAWIFFDWGETAFVMYAAVYLALGIAAMLISGFVRMRVSP